MEEGRWRSEVTPGRWLVEPLWSPSADLFPNVSRDVRPPTKHDGGWGGCIPSFCPRVLVGYRYSASTLSTGQDLEKSLDDIAAYMTVGGGIHVKGRSVLQVVRYKKGDRDGKLLAKQIRLGLASRGIALGRTLTQEVEQTNAPAGWVNLRAEWPEPEPPGLAPRRGAPRLQRVLRPGEGPPVVACPDVPAASEEHVAWRVEGVVLMEESAGGQLLWFRDSIAVRNVSGGVSPPVLVQASAPCAGEVVVPSLCPAADFHVLCGRRSGAIGAVWSDIVTSDIELSPSRATVAETLTLSIEAGIGKDTPEFVATLLDTPVGFAPSAEPLRVKLTQFSHARRFLFDYTRRREELAPPDGWRSARLERAGIVSDDLAVRRAWLARREVLEDTARVGDALRAVLDELEKETGFDAAEFSEARKEAARLVRAREDAERITRRLRD